MANFWDNRYALEEYVYGTLPNVFFSETLLKFQPGRILLPAEGEGRNAVFAAKMGWQVTAFDLSTEGQRKAMKLAEKQEVTIDYLVESFDSVLFPENYFDNISLVFAHLPATIRTKIHQKLILFLKPGGSIIMEAFSKKQLGYNSGGPSDIEMLYSAEELKFDFGMLSQINIEEMEIILKEGDFHDGKASVIRLIGIK